MNFKKQLQTFLCGCLFLVPAFISAQTLLSDFEVKGGKALWGSWYSYTDSTNLGTSNLTTVVDGQFGKAWGDSSHVSGADGTAGALKVGFILGTKRPYCNIADTSAKACTYDPQIGIGVNAPDSSGSDLTGLTGISFWGKADALTDIAISIECDSIDPSNQDFASLTTEWKKFNIKIADMAQPSWVAKPKQKKVNPAAVKALRFVVARGGAGYENNAEMTSGAIYLDQIVLEGYVPSAIKPQLNAAQGLKLSLVGSHLRVDLPSDQAGIVVITNAQGQEVSRAAFTQGQKFVNISLKPGQQHSALFAKLHK